MFKVRLTVCIAGMARIKNKNTYFTVNAILCFPVVSVAAPLASVATVSDRSFHCRLTTGHTPLSFISMSVHNLIFRARKTLISAGCEDAKSDSSNASDRSIRPLLIHYCQIAKVAYNDDLIKSTHADRLLKQVYRFSHTDMEYEWRLLLCRLVWCVCASSAGPVTLSSSPSSVLSECLWGWSRSPLSVVEDTRKHGQVTSPSYEKQKNTALHSY